MMKSKHKLLIKQAKGQTLNNMSQRAKRTIQIYNGGFHP